MIGCVIDPFLSAFQRMLGTQFFVFKSAYFCIMFSLTRLFVPAVSFLFIPDPRRFGLGPFSLLLKLLVPFISVCASNAPVPSGIM
jgi:hypothetical protein